MKTEHTMESLLREARDGLDRTNDFLWREVYRDAQTGPDTPPEPADAVAAEAASHCRANQATLDKIRVLLSALQSPAPETK